MIVKLSPAPDTAPNVTPGDFLDIVRDALVLYIVGS
jgi:hypothetical protein